jgi:hypothetical protein
MLLKDADSSDKINRFEDPCAVRTISFNLENFGIDQTNYSSVLICRTSSIKFGS